MVFPFHHLLAQSLTQVICNQGQAITNRHCLPAIGGPSAPDCRQAKRDDGFVINHK